MDDALSEFSGTMTAKTLSFNPEAIPKSRTLVICMTRAAAPP